MNKKMIVTVLLLFSALYGYNLPNAFFNHTMNRIYVEMPVMLAYRFTVSNTMKLVLNGGGYVSYGIDGKYKRTKYRV